MGVSLGMQLTAILGFIAVMLLLQPVMILVMPKAAALQYFGKTGLVNETYIVFSTNFQSPVLQQANSTLGFGAASSLQNTVGGLAFVYGALGYLWKSLINFPNMLLIIFESLSSNVLFIPAAITAVAAIVFLSYVVISDFFILLSMWMKSDALRVGE